MIRKNTWLLLVLLLGLVGFSFYLTDQKSRKAAQATPTLGSATLFTAADGSPADIKIVNAAGDAVEVARDQSGNWVVKAPTEAPADQASAEAAATQISALRVLANVQLGPDVVGLDKPSYTITVTFGAQTIHKLIVGSVTPIQSGYYVQLDGGPNQVVDKFGLDALLGMLTHPPYPATATPASSPTPTPAPATTVPALTSTPASSAGPAYPTPHGTLTPPASLQKATGTSTP
jgi:hypothetical protein